MLTGENGLNCVGELHSKTHDSTGRGVALLSFREDYSSRNYLNRGNEAAPYTHSRRKVSCGLTINGGTASPLPYLSTDRLVARPTVRLLEDQPFSWSIVRRFGLPCNSRKTRRTRKRRKQDVKREATVDK